MTVNYVDVVMSHWDLAASCRQPWHKRVSVIGPGAAFGTDPLESGQRLRGLVSLVSLSEDRFHHKIGDQAIFNL